MKETLQGTCSVDNPLHGPRSTVDCLLIQRDVVHRLLLADIATSIPGFGLFVNLNPRPYPFMKTTSRTFTDPTGGLQYQKTRVNPPDLQKITIQTQNRPCPILRTYPLRRSYPIATCANRANSPWSLQKSSILSCSFVQNTSSPQMHRPPPAMT